MSETMHPKQQSFVEITAFFSSDIRTPHKIQEKQIYNPY